MFTIFLFILWLYEGITKLRKNAVVTRKDFTLVWLMLMIFLFRDSLMYIASWIGG